MFIIQVILLQLGTKMSCRVWKLLDLSLNLAMFSSLQLWYLRVKSLFYQLCLLFTGKFETSICYVYWGLSPFFLVLVLHCSKWYKRASSFWFRRIQLKLKKLDSQIKSISKVKPKEKQTKPKERCDICWDAFLNVTLSSSFMSPLSTFNIIMQNYFNGSTLYFLF